MAVSQRDTNLKASALFYSIVVALVVTITTTGLLSAFFFNKMVTTDLIQDHQQINNLESATTLLLNSDLVDQNVPLITDLYGLGKDSVVLQRYQWGSYELATSEVVSSNNSLKRAFFMADEVKAPQTLLLADGRYPLALAGQALLDGECTVPKTGIKRGYIGQRGFERDQLVQGTVNYEGKSLPELALEQEAFIQSLYSNSWQRKSIKQHPLDRLPKNVENSFFAPTLVFSGDEDLYLNQGQVSGNVIIRTTGTITIDPSFVTDGVVLFGEKIRVLERFRGSVQLYAVEELIVDAGSYLKYPSTAAITGASAGYLRLNENSKVEGAVLCLSDDKKTIVQLDKNATIQGTLYSAGKVQHKGKVYGNTYTSGFIVKAAANNYLNHILDGELSYPQRDKLVSVRVTEEAHSPTKKIVQWLR